MPRHSSFNNLAADLAAWDYGVLLSNDGSETAGAKRFDELARANGAGSRIWVYYPKLKESRRYVWGGSTGVKSGFEEGCFLLNKTNAHVKLSVTGKRAFKQFLAEKSPNSRLRRV